MRRLRSALRLSVLALALAGAGAGAARAQDADPLARAEALEEQQQWRAAGAAYRDALAKEPGSLGALLGLERVYDQLGARDSLMPYVDRALRLEPRDTGLRTLQLRTARYVGGRGAVRAAFESWRRAAPGDAAPYRAYARMLLAEGDAAAADTILAEAAATTGDARNFAYETAMLQAARGQWVAAAAAWREAATDRPYFAQAAVYSLTPAPVAQRDGVRRALAAPPAAAGARSVLASLELAWGDPRRGWEALRVLPPDSLRATVWRDFAQRAEAADAWLVARDALVAAATPTLDGPLFADAARDALRGGDARGADSIAALSASVMDSASAAALAVPVRVEALSVLGRGRDAERVAAAYAPYAAPEQRAAMARWVAWAWVRAGDLSRARASLEASGEDAGDAAGWFALYEGDLAAARRALAPERARSADELMAVAILGRTTKDRSTATGAAFLALARGDSAAAARQFALAAAELPDAAPLLLAQSARLEAARGDDRAAIAIWQRIVEQMPQSPEAPASDLAWARALRRSHQDAAAVARLEHLILNYPDSALLPQARRELDAARRAGASTS